MSTAIITNKGLALLAKLTQGNTLEITSAKTGAGTVDSALLKEQTGVATPKQALTIQSIIDQGDGECDLVLSLTNEEVTSSYPVSQIGIYANDPDEGEILYCLYQADSEEMTTIPSATVIPGYNAEWQFRLKYDQADSVSVTMDPLNTVTRSAMENYIKEATTPEKIRTTMDEADIITTYGTGAAYTATVPGITRLKAGVSFMMVPHVTSTTKTPTLNVNGLGAKAIRQPLATNTGASATAVQEGWLSEGKPTRVTYDGTLWKIATPRPSAYSLYGAVNVENGGTGADNAEEALTNLGAFPRAGGVPLTGPLILTQGVHYGTSLPSAGTKGRIFFLVVDD